MERDTLYFFVVTHVLIGKPVSTLAFPGRALSQGVTYLQIVIPLYVIGGA